MKKLYLSEAELRNLINDEEKVTVQRKFSGAPFIGTITTD